MIQKSPSEKLQQDEFLHMFYSFCTYVSLLYDKKMNFATVFIKMIENKNLRDIFKSVANEDTDFKLIQLFIQTEPSICKSKYVTKFLNNFKGI